MTVTTPLLTRRAVLQVAMETTYRTEVTPGINDALYVEDPDYSVDVAVIERNFSRDDLSPLPNVSGRKMASMKFKTELKGNNKQNTGIITDAPLLARLFRACGYAITAYAVPKGSKVFPSGVHANEVTWVVDDSTCTQTDVIAYYIKVTTGGASGVAAVTVTSDTVGEQSASAVLTTAVAKTLGTKNLKVTPTFTGSLVVGQMWVVWALPRGLHLDPISTGFESTTMVMNKDGVQHKMLGTFGSFSISAEAGDKANIDWEFQGTYEAPTDVTLPICNYEKSLPKQVELARLRTDSDYLVVNAFNYTQNNDIQIRPDVSAADGYIGTRIVSRNPEGGIDPEAERVADHDFWGKLSSSRQMSFSMRVGTDAGNTVWFIAPSVQYTGLSYQDRNGLLAYDAALKFSRVFGNDELKIFLC